MLAMYLMSRVVMSAEVAVECPKVCCYRLHTRNLLEHSLMLSEELSAASNKTCKQDSSMLPCLANTEYGAPM